MDLHGRNLLTVTDLSARMHTIKALMLATLGPRS